MRGRASCVFLVLAFLTLGPGIRPAAAQVSAALTGRVGDASGAAVAAANVTVKNVETSAPRATVTDAGGHYEVLELPVGEYEVTVTKDGFAASVRGGIHLVVGQQAAVDFALRVGEVRQQVVVTEEAPVVNASTSDISGVVGEEQMKNLPLNGRSYDLLMTLDPGVVNFTWEKTGGTGISNSTVGNNFAVAGNRPQQNLFLLNGVEFTGAAENNMQPGGTSQELLGVDAVREFNVLRNAYGAEYGKRPGGQVLIVTRSGSNRWHGSAFEFLRNNDFDSPGYFDQGSAPPFQRNQFGGSLGGPVQTDKTFVFGSYEGLRQRLHVTDVTNVPDLASRASVAPGGRVALLLNLWPTPPVGAPDSGGIAQVTSFPLQAIRDDFGTLRLDHRFSARDSGNAIYTIDDSADNSPGVNPYMTDVESLREQVFSLEETHVLSSSLLNTARFGFSRASYFFDGKPTPGTPAAAVNLSLVAGLRIGAVNVGGSTASNPATQISLAGSNNGSNLDVNRNLFTYEDRISWTKGRHQFTFGAWFQRVESNENIALSQYGQLTFSSLQTFLAGTTATLIYDPASTPLGWRSLFGAGYAEDAIRLNPRLTLSLGFRSESSSGWNEAQGRAANYTFSGAGAIQCASLTGNWCLPSVGNAAFSVNRAKFLPQPRIGVAWTPFGTKTVIRAGFGMYNDLQDALGYRMDQNAPFNPTFSAAIANFSTFTLPINCTPSSGACPGSLAPGGVQPDLKTPTVVSYSFAIEREITPNTSLSVGYLGNHGYHELVSADTNEPTPTICPAAPCPAVHPATFPVGIAGTPVPAGTYYIQTGTPKPNPALAASWEWLSEGISNYNAMVVDFTRRVSRGLAFRGVYTWSKTLDDGDTLNVTTAANAAGLVANPFDIKADYGPATFDVRHAAAASASYALPFGPRQRFLGNVHGVAGVLIGGWKANSIVTIQSGFPVTPQLSYNPANNGDGKNPVRPFVNPAFTGNVVLGTPAQWFNPQAFLAPPANSGFYGNLGRDTVTGPGLATWDFSAVKDTRLRENLNLQFRAEIFNVLNRVNFNTPNPIVFVTAPTGPVISSTAGQITSLSTPPRQVQFGVKLLW